MIETATFRYNGVDLRHPMRTECRVRPAWSQDGRTVLYVEHEFTVNAFAFADAPGANDTGDTVEDLRKRLMAPGKEFIATGKGLGDDLHVNRPDGSGMRDAHLGPRPVSADFVVMGGEGNAVKVRWVVVVNVPRCGEDAKQEAVSSMAWGVTHEINDIGLTVERVEGLITLNQSLRANGRLAYCVDQWRDSLLQNMKPPLGFRRTTRQFTTSPDQCELRFSWTDTENGRPPPDGVSKIRATHTLESSLAAAAFTTQIVTIDATISGYRGVSRSVPLLAFLKIAGSRLEGHRKAGRFILTQNLRFTEDVYAESSSFSINCTVVTTKSSGGSFFGGSTVGPESLWRVLNESRLWTPIDGTSHASWDKSMQAAKAFAPRGTAGLTVASGEAIIDVCDGDSYGLTPPPAASLPVRVSAADMPSEVENTAGGGVLASLPPGINPDFVSDILNPGVNTNKPPPAPSSWLAWSCKTFFRETPSLSLVRKSPAKPIGVPQGVNPPPREFLVGLSEGGQRPEGPAGPPQPPPVTNAYAASPIVSGSAAGVRDSIAPPDFHEAQGDSPQDEIHVGGSPRRTVSIYGFGVRVGYRVPVPRLLYWGGVPVVEVDRMVEEDSKAILGGPLRIYRTDWRVDYVLTRATNYPGPVLADPVQGLDGFEQ